MAWSQSSPSPPSASDLSFGRNRGNNRRMQRRRRRDRCSQWTNGHLETRCLQGETDSVRCSMPPPASHAIIKEALEAAEDSKTTSRCSRLPLESPPGDLGRESSTPSPSNTSRKRWQTFIL